MGLSYESCVVKCCVMLRISQYTFCFQCVAKDHHKLPCGAGKDHTQPLSLVDRALIMGLALLYERETGYPWSLTHRPTEAFRSCFPIEPLPSPEDKTAFLNAVTEMVQRGVTRFATEMPQETAVAERIRAPLEGLMGWHDFGSEDGSYNKDAHSSAEGASTELGVRTPDTKTLLLSLPRIVHESPSKALTTPKKRVQACEGSSTEKEYEAPKTSDTKTPLPSLPRRVQKKRVSVSKTNTTVQNGGMSSIS